MRRLILASTSPRRRWLLEQVGLSFEVADSALDESTVGGGGRPPRELTQALALAKAGAVAGRLARSLAPHEAVVLGADTVVVLDGEVLGKPRDAAEAVGMLGRLQGRTHAVVTGVALVEPGGGRPVTAAEITNVTMRPLSPEQIRAYVASGEPLDKAGAYAIQGLGSVLVTRIEGCFYNVVGLPLALTADLLRRFGIEVLAGHGSEKLHPQGTAGR